MSRKGHPDSPPESRNARVFVLVDFLNVVYRVWSQRPIQGLRDAHGVLSGVEYGFYRRLIASRREILDEMGSGTDVSYIVAFDSHEDIDLEVRPFLERVVYSRSYEARPVPCDISSIHCDDKAAYTKFYKEAYEQLISAYKTNRPLDTLSKVKMRSQLPGLSSGLRRTRAAQLYAPGYEADDIIATVVHKLESKQPKQSSDFVVIIMSTDYDLTPLLTMTRKGFEVRIQSRASNITRQDVVKKTGVEPQHLLIYKVFEGDRSDNIHNIIPRGKKDMVKVGASSGLSVDEIARNIGVISRSMSLSQVLRVQATLRARQDILSLRTDVPYETVPRLSDISFREHLENRSMKSLLDSGDEALSYR